MAVELIPVTSEVPKETHEVWAAVSKLVEQTRIATEDGFQAGEDLAKIVMGSLTDLSKAMDNLKQAAVEHQEDLADSVLGHGVGMGMVGKEIVLVIKKPAPDAPAEAPASGAV